MNKYRQRYIQLLLVAVTVVALFAYPLIPAKLHLVTESEGINVFIYGSDLPNGESSAIWLNEEERHIRCIYPPDIPDYSYYCSFNIGYEFGEGTGIDLSQYTHIRLSVEYTGTAPKLRLFARNYDSAYSKPDDTNSSKYNAIFLATKDLDGEITLSMNEFIVTEWWLLSYKIPREKSFTQLDNIVNLGLDFSDSMTVGNHDLKVNKIELVGEWVSRENWYLTIIILWLSGIFIQILIQLHVFRKLKFEGDILIKSLNESNINLAKEKDKFRKLSTIDALTNVFNRFGIDQIVSALIASANNTKEDQPTFSLLLIDIDYFKRINDRRGHDAGDKVLRKVTEIITKQIRDCDYVGRWGGEEFIVILPFTNHWFALALAEKIRMIVSTENFESENSLHITISTGIGSLMESESFADVFKRVDEALYKAKGAGRNCSILADPHQE